MKFYITDEIIPLINAETTSFCEATGDHYVVGAVINGEHYACFKATTAEDADFYAEELTRLIESTNAANGAVSTPTDEDSVLLAGFTFTPNKGMAKIYVGDSDKTTRLYLKGGFDALLGVKPGKKVLIAFNRVEEAFAIVKPNSPAVNSEMKEAGYFVSQRKDVTCARLFRDFNLEKYRGQTFYADETSLSGNVVIFRR